MPTTLPATSTAVNPDLEALAASFAAEDAEFGAWLDAHADEMAEQAEMDALVETFVRF